MNVTVEHPEKAEESCRTNVTLYKTERVVAVNADNEHYCFVRTVQDKTTCTIPYVYEFQADKTILLRIADKDCRTSMHAAFVPVMISGIVLLVGIIILLTWKCWTSIKDRREYAKFEQDQKRTVYALDENPLFRSPITQFTVPSVCREE